MLAPGTKSFSPECAWHRGKGRPSSSMGLKSPTKILPSALVRSNRALFLDLARKYIWWRAPEEAIEHPARVLAQVMNIGVFADMMRMASALGDEGLRRVIRHAEPGQFSERSWHYWHYRLELAEPGEVPPLPFRHLPQGNETGGL